MIEKEESILESLRLVQSNLSWFTSSVYSIADCHTSLTSSAKLKEDSVVGISMIITDLNFKFIEMAKESLESIIECISNNLERSVKFDFIRLAEKEINKKSPFKETDICVTSKEDFEIMSLTHLQHLSGEKKLGISKQTTIVNEEENTNNFDEQLNELMKISDHPDIQSKFYNITPEKFNDLLSAILEKCHIKLQDAKKREDAVFQQIYELFGVKDNFVSQSRINNPRDIFSNTLLLI